MIVAFVSNILFPQHNAAQPSSPSPQTTQQEVFEIVTFDNRDFRYHLFSHEDNESIEIHSNLESRATSSQLKTDKNCTKLINGGFYSEEHTHIGWFVTKNEEISPYQENDLLNGFISVSSNTVKITEEPVDAVEFGVQTGPVLIASSRERNLRLTNDKARRRSFAFTTADNRTYFGIVMESNSSITGPYLDDLPTILTLIGSKEGLQIRSAINLDGGTASAYHDEEVSIPEINPIGSYFCIQS